jgi:predicted DCC family thiol-disulfide oxidoreductase YuxK
MTPSMSPIDLIVYDGVCVLCSRSMRFVATRDTARRFRFVPLQSPYGAVLAARFRISTENPDTYIAIIDGVARFRSDATLAILARLPGWRWTRLFRVIPRPIRDACYTLVARNRYRWFGRFDACPLPPPAFAAQVMSEVPQAGAHDGALP